MAKSYTERLKDPRWQKKRLEIFQRDKWACRGCGSKATTLSVHHVYYERGKSPWEYENEFLLTLCDPCHKQEKEKRKEVEQGLLYYLRMNGYLCWHLDQLCEGLPGLAQKYHPLWGTDHGTALLVGMARHEDLRNRVRKAHQGLPQLVPKGALP
jgi:hypothetical protein